MRRIATVAIVAIATIFGALNSTPAQCDTDFCRPPPLVTTTRVAPTLLGWYGIGSVACAAVSPIMGALVLGRELTVTEVDRMALSCFLGPVGWLLGPVLVPDQVVTTTEPPQYPPPNGPRQARGLHIDILPLGVTSFVPNEVLLELVCGAPAEYLNVIARRLQMTLLETQSFTLTDRTLRRAAEFPLWIWASATASAVRPRCAIRGS
jgi:hypothetical protein